MDGQARAALIQTVHERTSLLLLLLSLCRLDTITSCIQSISKLHHEVDTIKDLVADLLAMSCHNRQSGYNKPYITQSGNKFGAG